MKFRTLEIICEALEREKTRAVCESMDAVEKVALFEREFSKDTVTEEDERTLRRYRNEAAIAKNNLKRVEAALQDFLANEF